MRVARRSGAFFVFKRCQRPAGGRGDYHRHRFQNANFAQTKESTELYIARISIMVVLHTWKKDYAELLSSNEAVCQYHKSTTSAAGINIME